MLPQGHEDGVEARYLVVAGSYHLPYVIFSRRVALLQRVRKRCSPGSAHALPELKPLFDAEQKIGCWIGRHRWAAG